MTLEKNWRWFGPQDPITLAEIRQTGVAGIVTALHQIPIGAIWTDTEIQKRKQLIESAGFKWHIVESLPVHEDIKKGSGNYRQYIDNYKASLHNLGRQGIDTVCYNFMPVLDWSRTDLGFVSRDGSITTKFEANALAAFDLFILERPNAEKDYSMQQLNNAGNYFNRLDRSQKDRLTETILLGSPGSLEAYSLTDFRMAIAAYTDISAAALRENLADFIREIIPVAEQAGIRMAIHPDDPPWSLLGLPRIVSTKTDIDNIISILDSPSNGFVLCSGSLGARADNDLVDMVELLGYRINFAHLRNVRRSGSSDFTEDLLLEGDLDVYAILKALLIEQNRRRKSGREDHCIPLRPDHGYLMIAEQNKAGIYPGYSFIGRLRALSELRGLETAILRTKEIANSIR